jgi:hypothetical protein
MTPRASLRASDADRDAVAERLRRAAVEGRLEPDELEQRLHAALRSRTYGQLDRLLVDLPSPARPRPRITRSPLAFAIPLLATLVVLAAVVTIVAIAAAGWMVWVLVWCLVWAGRGGCGRRRHSAHRTRAV